METSSISKYVSFTLHPWKTHQDYNHYYNRSEINLEDNTLQVHQSDFSDFFRTLKSEKSLLFLTKSEKSQKKVRIWSASGQN